VSGDSPIPGTALPQGEVDAEGADEKRAFALQTRVFAFIGLFMFVVSIGYAAWTQEPAGSALLALAGGLATTTAAYLGWPRHPVPDEDRVRSIDARDEAPWFPEASIWPFAMGLAVFLVANGILLGLWLLIPASFVLAFAVTGFVLQSRRRS
jgi:hypothetical protein